MKNEYLAGVLLLSGLLVGFFTGREFPRETLLEKECRGFAENIAMRKKLSYPEHSQPTTKDPLAEFNVPEITYETDPKLFAFVFARCMRGGL